MIIFLYGEDEYRSLQKLTEIKNKFLEKNKEGASLFVFDFAEKDWNIGEVLANITSEGLFSRKRLAIIKNILASKKEVSDNFEKFLKIESKNDKSDLILLFWEAEMPKKSEKLFKLIQKVARCQEFELLEGTKLKKWISIEFERQGSSIDAFAIEKLAIFVGNDLNLLSREIEKLASYKNGSKIAVNDVELLVKSKIDTDIFKTIDALSRGNKKTAAKLLHEHLDSGEDPFYLLSMYFFQFRNLLKVKPLAEKNLSPREISGKLKIHPYVAQKSVEQGRNFSFERLKEIYRSLCEIDFSTKTGKEDILLALDKFVAGV